VPCCICFIAFLPLTILTHIIIVTPTTGAFVPVAPRRVDPVLGSGPPAGFCAGLHLVLLVRRRAQGERESTRVVACAKGAASHSPAVCLLRTLIISDSWSVRRRNWPTVPWPTRWCGATITTNPSRYRPVRSRHVLKQPFPHPCVVRAWAMHPPGPHCAGATYPGGGPSLRRGGGPHGRVGHARGTSQRLPPPAGELLAAIGDRRGALFTPLCVFVFVDYL
jgi:hypothetical protein